ncbi:catechol 2,3-dioxygenase-like lactoylglutathione lyase family enzyme [Jatrophihabitans sp. GAS493]|uniref:VOC family protein n=1 Tax=Jatrophihabitans sp. GAS493 TaxID=1907575 RepID=UPI000BB76466|nr:VOC family protein [Jatrophihabitans sp. GAS493]SOD74035.1 catechol 2,3-dioxygenase-like lactoylglutathione lyase family enzyme [Jatrophihabitans sp. GAS493]
MSSSARLDHVTIGASDLARSAAFYDAALAAVELYRVVEFIDEEEEEGPTEAIGYGPAARSTDALSDSLSGAASSDAHLWVVMSTPATHSAHAALRAESRQQVEAFYAAAVAAGGVPRQRPRRWEVFRPGYFGASVADPDGNILEVFSHE